MNITKELDRVKADTPDDAPQYLAIHSPTRVQIAEWDDWAIEAAEMLKRHGWVAKRTSTIHGSGLHLHHPAMIMGAA